jgi:multidrug efflux pump subunit AcrA (membrane-fusion protein)
MWELLKKGFLFCWIVFAVCSCGGEKKAAKSKQETLTLVLRPYAATLFYSGVVQPLKTKVITSPADGVIQEMMVHYGDQVKEGDLLFTISSEKFQTDYKNALMQYIKSKNDFNTSHSQLEQGEFLHHNQLISDDDYKTKKSAYYTAQLALIQAKEVLNTMLKQLAVQGLKLDELTIENIDKITQALHAQGDTQKLRVVASSSGAVLLPLKSEGESETKKVGKGDQVKQGDVLAVIGDISGLMIHVSVNEFNINELKLGQSVKVTGAAFPNFVLQGKISGIDRQAQSNSGGMPTFPIEITVPTLSLAQQKIIHIGMSAKVEVSIQSDPQLSVPLVAVFEKNGQAYVKKADAKTGKIQEVLVKAGQSTRDSVVIESGLQEGDQIVFAS